MADEPDLLSDLSDGLQTLTLNRPDKLNALNWRLMRLLQDALREAAADPGVRCVLLTGSGRGFCSGGDLKGRTDLDDPVAVRWSDDPAWNTVEQKTSQAMRFVSSATLLHTMPKPTVAAIRGPTAGAGLCLAAACDFRIVSRTAMFTTVFVQSGRSGDFGGSYLLTKLVGAAKARELYMLGERINAETADRLGLVTRLVDDEGLDDAARDFARKLAEGPTLAYRYIKQNLAAAETMTLPQILEMEALHMMRCSASEDAKEAALAAKERRWPVFKGR